MDSVNKTLYIPLYGKAYVSRKGLFLKDPKAEEIWDSQGFPLRGKARSKWLAYYMGIRSAVFDDWVRQQLALAEDAVVIHIGCGLDSRIARLAPRGHRWYDVDFPEVIRERRQYYEETPAYRMIPGDVREDSWLDSIPETRAAVVIMEGVSMYLTPGELRKLTEDLCRHFEEVSLLMDCYSLLAAKLSRYKNPINQVGVTRVYGLDDPESLQQGDFVFTAEHTMTPQSYIDLLSGAERGIFRKLYAGGFAAGLYRLYGFEKRKAKTQ